MFESAAQAQQISDNLEPVRVETVTVNVLREGDIVIGVERGQQIEALKDKAYLVPAKQCTRRIAHGSEIVAVEQYTSARSLRQTSDHVQHRGFAAARGTHDGDKLARKNFNADAAQGRNVHFTLAIDLP